MENTLENKAKFFAQYWGQEVAFQNEGGGSGFKYDINEATICDIQHDYLLLTPLSHITDEDATYLSKIENDFENPVDRGRFLAVQINTSFFSIRSELFIQMIVF